MLLDFLQGRNPAYLEFELNLVDVRDVALGHVLAAERGRIGQRYILGGANLKLSQLLAMVQELTGQPMPAIRIPYAVAWTVAAVAQALADHVTRRPPMATLTGIRLAGAGLRIDGSKAARELGYAAGPIREAVRRAIAWLIQAKHLQLNVSGGQP
jgi:dihydroflavonol-4-reductase